MSRRVLFLIVVCAAACSRTPAPATATPEAPPETPTVTATEFGENAGTTSADTKPTEPAVPLTPTGDPKIEGRVSVSEQKALSESTLTVDTVLAKLHGMLTLDAKLCYDDQLKKRDSRARGTVTAAVVINKTGRAVPGRVHAFEEMLEACITARYGLYKFQFEIPKDKAGQPMEANFSFSLQLEPAN